MPWLALACFFWAQAGGLIGEPAGPRPRIVTTILPAFCIATNIGRDLVDVRSLIGSAGDGHDYQLTPLDRSNIEKAQLLLMNGLGIEPWLKKVVATKGGNARVIVLSRGLESQLISGDRDHGHHAEDGDAAHARGEMNPHLWLDPRLMCAMVTNALRGFQEMDPPNAARYAQNAVAYVDRLAALDRLLFDGLNGLHGAAMITYHDAFPYFARRYGLKIAGVIEEVPHADPTARHLDELARIIRAEKIRAIFVEPRHSQRLAARLGQDLGVRVGTLDTLEAGPASLTAYEDGMKKILTSLSTTLR
jgi:ABC-type Zn uptake system ZnuABC Zn-binding protein ZnuA